LKSDQIHYKDNIHSYKFHVYFETQFKTENGEKVEFSQVVWQKSGADFCQTKSVKNCPKSGADFINLGPDFWLTDNFNSQF